MPVKVAYRGSAWGTVQVESAPAEGQYGQQIDWVSGFALEPLGLEAPDALPVVAIGYLIAQKLHACTDHSDPDRENDRFRDLIDILLIWDLVAVGDRSAIHGACREIFSLRNKHSWPPPITVLAAWPDQYRAMAEQMSFALTDVHAAARQVEQIIVAIQAA